MAHYGYILNGRRGKKESEKTFTRRRGEEENKGLSVEMKNCNNLFAKFFLCALLRLRKKASAERTFRSKKCWVKCSEIAPEKDDGGGGRHTGRRIIDRAYAM